MAGKNLISLIKEPIYVSPNASHSLSGRNALIKPLLVAHDSAFISEKKNIRTGPSIALVSTFQALNNARVLFADINLFSNEFQKYL